MKQSLWQLLSSSYNFGGDTKLSLSAFPQLKRLGTRAGYYYKSNCRPNLFDVAGHCKCMRIREELDKSYQHNP